jgi:hypothetical protein
MHNYTLDHSSKNCVSQKLNNTIIIMVQKIPYWALVTQQGILAIVKHVFMQILYTWWTYAFT